MGKIIAIISGAIVTVIFALYGIAFGTQSEFIDLPFINFGEQETPIEMGGAWPPPGTSTEDSIGVYSMAYDWKTNLLNFQILQDSTFDHALITYSQNGVEVAQETYTEPTINLGEDLTTYGATTLDIKVYNTSTAKIFADFTIQDLYIPSHTLSNIENVTDNEIISLVAVVSGRFERGADMEDIYITNGTQNSVIYRADKTFTSHLEIGDRVYIKALKSSYYDLHQLINVEEVVVISNDNAIDTIMLTNEDLTTYKTAYVTITASFVEINTYGDINVDYNGTIISVDIADASNTSFIEGVYDLVAGDTLTITGNVYTSGTRIILQNANDLILP